MIAATVHGRVRFAKPCAVDAAYLSFAEQALGQTQSLRRIDGDAASHSVRLIQ